MAPKRGHGAKRAAQRKQPKQRQAAPPRPFSPSSRDDVHTEPSPPPAQSDARHRGPARFPIVVLGSSAGGLAALEQFFQHVPGDSGMAYVIVTHQAPDRVTLLPELLAKRSHVPFTTAAGGMKLHPNHAYVAPPGYVLTIKDGTVLLTAQKADAHPMLPIDLAFRSLAHNEGDRAIAVVLSGNGSDGTLGIAAVKSACGMVMAQDPRTAQYTGMPESAIATQLVDYVLPPEQMADQLIRYVSGQRKQPLTSFHLDEGRNGALGKILGVLRGRTGNDFGSYKKSTIKRRIERRMHLHGIDEPDEYARFLEQTAYEVDALFKELLISVTSFFRDPHAFEALEHELAKLVELKGHAQPLRIWIAGCATGEEAYSIAIVCKEVMQRSGKEFKVQIFATDLDLQAVDIARSGRYPEGIVADVTPERLSRFFTRDEHGYRVNKDVRELVVFAVQNVVKDPPFTKLDLLSCRNLLIYLETDLQKRVLGLFCYSLRPDGLLLLGTSESVSGFDERFATLDKRWKLFQRLPTPVPQGLPDFFAERQSALTPGVAHPQARDGHRGTQGIANIADRVLLGAFVPPSVIVSERGELIYVHGRVGAYFEPATGAPSQNVFGMAREGLRAELPGAIRQAASSQKTIVRRGLQVKTNGAYTRITLTARRLAEPETLRGAYVVSFEVEREIEGAPKKRGRVVGRSPERVRVLEDELRRTREDQQGMIEELETSNEELKSTNEELQSTNEELQSANEELETSREEMQSLNEELQTVNAELEERNRALAQANDDMQNLLNSTDVATVFLDDQLRIKRFTMQARRIFNLIESDIGRPISDLKVNLLDDALVAEAQEVLRTLVFTEREVQTNEGGWRLMRIMPYRTHENLIDGLVMTFVDIDRLKAAQRNVKVVRNAAEDVVDAMDSAVLLLDGELHGVLANRAFYAAFDSNPQRVVGRSLRDVAAWGTSAVVDRLCELLGDGKEFELELPAGSLRDSATKVVARRLPKHSDRPVLLLLSFDPA